MKVLVSACLLGENCKYNGKNNKNDAVLEFLKGKEVIGICPEVLAGLGTPRPRAELLCGVAMDEYGTNIHAAFRHGVERALDQIKDENIDLVILQSRSPSCGVKQIYDGSFSGTKIPGMGLFAKALTEHGYHVIDAEDVPTYTERNLIDHMKTNYYNSLCTELYEILHKEAPADELEFYLSYAEQGMSILEPLCGSGRFLVPFLERGYSIQGVDSSKEMLGKLLEKSPDAAVVQCAIEEYQTEERFDYIFISSGSVSLFTDMQVCKAILTKMKTLLKKGGKFVFAVDTAADRCPDDADYKVSVSVETRDKQQLVLRSKDYYEEATHTQFSPAFYELYDGEKLLRQEPMDFQTHLYELGEMDAILKEIGFTDIKVYSTFDKDIAQSNDTEQFLYECSI